MQALLIVLQKKNDPHKAIWEDIQGVLLDVKHLMQIAEKRSETDIRQLAEIIEEHCSDHGQAD